MPKEKVTITLDRSKADDARALIGARSTSEVIDVALERLLRAERLKHDVAAYRQAPPSGDELDLAPLGAAGDLDDGTNWEALYPEVEL